MRSPFRLLQNEDGFALYLAVFLAAILMLVGVVSIRTSSTESLTVRNEGLLMREFYGAEGGVMDALEHYNGGATFWLTDDFLLAGPAAAGAQVTSRDLHGTAMAAVEARCIEDTGAVISSLSDAANTVPPLKHIGPPPSGSGYSMKFFEARRYAVTGTSTAGNTHVQVGAWKVFNKYN
jgi:hypothetical protein